LRVFTVHLREEREPVLVPEGFAWGALFFGPLWLASYAAWVPAALALAATVLIIVFTDGGTTAVLLLALYFLLGLSGYDLRRWALANRRYLLAQVLVAPTEEQALGRLLDHRADLRASFMPAGAAR
jgi:hypothetical protein